MTAKVFRFVENVRARGRSIIFIGHNIYHVYDIADRFVVLDRGKVVMTEDRANVASAEVLIKHMQEIAQLAHDTDPQPASAGETIDGQ